jgi:hypothetical protein
MEQCLYIKRDECNGTLKDADLYNYVKIRSVPYKFDFIGNIRRTNLSHEIKSKEKSCIDEINFINEVNHEKKLLNQLYFGNDFSGISKCDEKCKNCLGYNFSDRNRFQIAFYITSNDNIPKTRIKVKWNENDSKIFELDEFRQCNSVVFENGNSKCCYKIEAYTNINNINLYNEIYISNSFRFPVNFLNIYIDDANNTINFTITRAPNGSVCPLGSFEDNETMY